MSAVNLRRPVLANLVARRVEPVPDPKHRELIWWLQELSLRRPGAPHGTCALFSSITLSPLIEGATSFEQLSHDLCSRYPDRLSAPVAKVVRVLPAFFMRLCLDPRLDVATAVVPRFRDIIPALQETRAAYEAAHLEAVAPTSVTKAVWEILDFCREQGGIVLAEGHYRSGNRSRHRAGAWRGRDRFATSALEATRMRRVSCAPSHPRSARPPLLKGKQSSCDCE